MTYFSAIKLDVIADPNNSSSDNLDSGNGYKFEGAATSTLNVNSIQVSLYANKNCHVYVEQSPDDTPHWDISDEYFYSSGENFGITVQAINSYVRVRVLTNNETTTEFRLQTVLCPIADPLPRSLDRNGNLRVANSVDEYGFSTENTPFGELRVIEPVRLVGATFVGASVDSNFWLTTALSNASANQANGEMVLTSGSQVTGSIVLQSNRKARYTGGAVNRFRAQVQFSSSGNDGNTKKWGMYDGTDGAYFKLAGSSLEVCTMRAGVETPVAASNWNGTTSSPTSMTSLHAYEIYATNGKVYFVIGDELCHTVNAAASTWSSTLTLPARAESANSASQVADSMMVRVMTIYRLGKLETLPTYKNFTSASTAIVCKYGPGNLHRVVVNKPANSTITIYDNVGASSPIIATIDAGATAVPFNLEYHVPFANGLCITTGGAFNATIVYE